VLNNIIQSIPGQTNIMEPGIGIFFSMDVEFAMENMYSQVHNLIH